MGDPRPGEGTWAEGEPELPLWELIQTSYAVARGFTEVFGAVGLTPIQFGVLASLADGDDDLSQADLARAVNVRPQSLGEVATGLIGGGLVEREGPGGRGRRAGLRITAAGRALLDRVLPGVAAFNAPESTGLSAAESAELIRALRTIRETLSGGR
ncbi:DNA-binding MarR family transcriptional regulator [Murinocardiopsis flavida]|uniref:DNA-binding MarR family transcriptional regulator n=1 Tax=Murinocardiopsis flavida TaxID=645275 RepID=A0A2P8DNP1_9ACTN|nr:MarR family winged helix-turn-helix transcriptional regulator [Murinocardiopsis flavida]PSK98838.1 DNA-binding MarR family transcriptional regulator [Murinocardiopsis flavida]